MKKSFLAACITVMITATHLSAQVTYPYPTHSITLNLEGKTVNMVYMDVASSTSSGKTILLLHGKNFNGYYWKDVIPFLNGLGYRVIVPDQLGWGKSDHPDLHYSFHLLASNTKALLDTLDVKKLTVLGHSMGGMLAVRFTLMFPGMVEKLILENPIGLEDYKTFIRYQPLDALFAKEKKATYASYKKYQETYYPVWKPEYEQYVQAQAADLQLPDFEKIAWVNALTYQMIYEQPVIYELDRINIATLLIVGQADRTVVGKDQLSDADKSRYGQYPALGKKVKRRIKGSRLVELQGVGHIPHIQKPQAFRESVTNFLAAGILSN
jgi:pimeloyl-ACP methyl ester carboxylesterase